MNASSICALWSSIFGFLLTDMAQVGDVIVVSNDGDTTRALMGKIMFTYNWLHFRGTAQLSIFKSGCRTF
ncbi:MAG: hypothetical protein ACK5L0_04445 [Candidatus Fimivivens sp.]